MAMQVGDKCPQCRQGLLERTELGIACSDCPFEMEIEEVVKANNHARTHARGFVFRPKTFRITVEDPDDGEEFLRGLILARQNNNSEYFPDLIDAVNSVLEPWRAARLDEEMAKRGE